MIEMYRKLAPGIRHVTDTHYLDAYAGDPLTGLVEREIQVAPQLWPFEAGETPIAYARRIVAGIDAGALVTEVRMTADVSYFRGGESVDEEIVITYRTERKPGKE